MNIYKSLKEALNLSYNIVGLKLLFEDNIDDDLKKNFIIIKKRERFSKYIKRAAKGEFLKINSEFTNCITKGGSKDDVVLSDHVEMEMKLKFRGLEDILLFPVDKAPQIDVDSIILMVTPLECTKIIEVYVELYKEPLRLVTGAHFGVCSEIAAYVIKREDVNFSFLCHGAREYGKFKNSELLCGIPKKRIKEISKKLIREKEI
ncbi:MAG: hypothetical protein BAJALOKI2v1_380026 [Promethearchaeota archaeon]|nr:MAG: hypothetical protein BAJALOKI2v1_380026 [Candidatus Lokiarchaeota archaeon]